jgi:hypothetical protein
VNEICFLTASRGNAFMTELLSTVAGAVAAEGIEVSFAVDRYPPLREGVAYVAITHEFFELAPRGGDATPGHLHRTVGFCVELPGTEWFAATCRHGKRLGALVDIRSSGVAALKVAGLASVHAPLGYTSTWDRWGRDETTPRPIDLLYMGSGEARRDQLLAGYADTLVGHASRLLIPPELPKTEPGPSFLVGDEKYELLKSSKALLNLHRVGAWALEWPRVLEAICNGCVVVTERSVDIAPLIPGEHLIATRAESLCLLADRLLDDPDRLQAIRLAAYDFVRRELPMSTGARRLIEVAEGVVRSRPAPAPVEEPIAEPVDRTAELVEEAVAPLRAAVKRVLIETRQARREHAELGVDVVAATPAYGSRTPRVTVGISLHNYESEIGDALASVAASDYEDYEVLVLDDASTDRSAEMVRRFFDEHPWMPAALMAHRSNAGLPRTRNAITEHARGELIFVLDADNGLYPHGLGRLVRALEADSAAAFAYPIIAMYERGRPSGLLSRHGWDPSLLAQYNSIDAMALIRREILVAIGGYCTDPRLMGLEDYDLWCQIAERDWRGVHVPEILAWYRQTEHSMVSIALLDLSEARSVLSSRAPRLFGRASQAGGYRQMSEPESTKLAPTSGWNVQP